MKIFCFAETAGLEIDNYGSKNVIFTRITRLTDKVDINCMHIKPKGLVGYHQATIPQLFLVVHGEGWVRGTTSERVKIRRGQAAYWEAGEWHESGTDTGMMAILVEIETKAFDPEEYLMEVKEVDCI